MSTATGRLVASAFIRLRGGGRLVAAMASLDNVTDVHQALRQHCPEVKVWMVNLARGASQLERIRFESLNPTFLVAVVKPE